jgi:hypothetical protein
MAGQLVGSLIGGVLDSKRSQGPRLSDTQVQISSYGAPLGNVYGSARRAGNVFWSTKLIESRDDSKKASATSAQPTYSVSCAVAICEGIHGRVQRIWGDSKLVYDGRADAHPATRAASDEFSRYFVFYPGTEDQLPDPTIEAEKGIGNVPGYRGTCYVVFTGLPLADFGNRIPNFTFELAEAADVEYVVGYPFGVSGTFSTIAQALDAAVDHAAEFGSTPINVPYVAGKTFYTFRTSVNTIASVFEGGATDAPPGAAVTMYFTDEFPNSIIEGTPYFCDEGAGGAGFVSPGFGSIKLAKDSGPGQFWGPFKHGPFPYQANARYPYILNYCTDSDNVVRSSAVCAPFTEIRYTVPIVGEGVPLSEIVEDICLRAGLAADQIDVAELTDIVVGYQVANIGTARAALEPLRAAFFFDAVESGDVIRFVKRGGDPVARITYNDLGAGNEDPGELIEPDRAQETDLPAEVVISYAALSADHQTGTQRSQRIVTRSQQRIAIEIPVVLPDQTAAAIADVLLADAWTSRTGRKIALTRKWCHIEPTDVIELNDGEFEYRCRVADKEEDGPVVRLVLRDEALATYSPESRSTNTPGGGGAVRIDGPTRLELLDIPLLTGTSSTPGLYMAAAGFRPGWRGARVFRSTGGAFAPVLDIKRAATIGYTIDALPNFRGGNIVDRLNAVTVEMLSGTLESITRAALLRDGNTAVLGDEVIQFQTAELIADRTYRLSGLLRGRLGTEQFINVHGSGDRFVLLDSRISRAQDDATRAGLASNYKPVTVGQSLDETAPQSFVNTQAALKPLSPVHLRVVRTDGGQYLASWIRRTRLDVGWIDGADAALYEKFERYRVTVLDGASVVELQTVNTPTATLSPMGADYSGFTVTVCQLSDAIGPGFPSSITIE